MTIAKNNKPTVVDTTIDETIIPETPVTTPEPVDEPIVEPVQEETVAPAESPAESIDLNAIIDQLHNELDDTRLAYEMLKDEFNNLKSIIATDYVPKTEYDERCNELAVEIQKNQGPTPKLQAALDKIKDLEAENAKLKSDFKHFYDLSYDLENELTKTNDIIVNFFTAVIPKDVLAEFLAKYQDNEAE